MRNLFLKIFLGFWLAMVIGGGIILLMLAVSGPPPRALRWHALAGAAMGHSAQTAVEVYEREGRSGLASLLGRMEQNADIRLFAFDSDGRELSGRDAPAPVIELLRRAQESDSFEYRILGDRTLAAQQATGPSGGRYILVGETQRGRTGILYSPRAWAMYLIASLLAASLVCYLLARYLSAPVVKLRAGVQRLASGDTSVRVGPSLGRRRDELADLARDFDAMAHRIAALISAQQRLLGDISHELRSPLTRLNLSLAIARQLAGDVAGNEHDRIEAEAERINALIAQLLTLTRLESGVVEIDKEPIDLKQLVCEIATDADFEAKNFNRAVCVLSVAECLTRGSHSLLRSAVENVVRNAVRYTAERTAVEITLRGAGGNSSAIIGVRDHGPGVPEETLDKMFRPFYRVADDRDSQSGGLGLGLAITERAVRLHGGEVKAENMPDGGGLLVEISLPL